MCRRKYTGIYSIGWESSTSGKTVFNKKMTTEKKTKLRMNKENDRQIVRKIGR
jgi:hypothetical protein